MSAQTEKEAIALLRHLAELYRDHTSIFTKVDDLLARVDVADKDPVELVGRSEDEDEDEDRERAIIPKLTDGFLSTLLEVVEAVDFADNVEAGKLVDQLYEMAGKPPPIKWNKP